jgi:hypothetical protein
LKTKKAKNKFMKRTGIGIMAALLPLWGSSYGAQKERTFSGEIMDSLCARDGSHAAMEKAHGMPVDKSSDKACTLACAKTGGSFALYDTVTKTVYQLSDQAQAEQFAGDKVKVTGDYEEASQTITVTKIQPAT